MPLEFIFWSFFHGNHQFRPWLSLGGYVTRDGMNPTGVRRLQCTGLLAVPERELVYSWLCMQPASMSCWGWGGAEGKGEEVWGRGKVGLAHRESWQATRIESGG